jgi:hypothetical protein
MGERSWYDECVRAATAAPSIHNTQPWLFRLNDDTIDVLVDRSRQLTTLDPDGREMILSVGAAVFNLRVAARALGRETRIQLWPDPDQPDLAARLTIGAAAGDLPAARALAEAIPRRHTNRRPFASKPVPYGTLVELSGGATAENATLVTVDPALRAAVLSLTRTAENRMKEDPQYRAELASWTTPGGVGRRDATTPALATPRRPVEEVLADGET